MGCDIHFYVEKKGADGVWRSADTWRDEGYGPVVPYRAAFYEGRNYSLFAILADVRNGKGFAGVKTGAGFVPISAPRGMPEDASAEVAKACEDYGCDGHSHSFHTLRQLLDFDWTQTTAKQGWTHLTSWVGWASYERGRGQGPNEYCGDVSERDVRKVGAEDMDALAREALALPHGAAREAFIARHSHVYGLAEWGTSYYRAASDFLASTVPRLLALAGSTQGADDVRAVFWFDN